MALEYTVVNGMETTIEFTNATVSSMTNGWTSVSPNKIRKVYQDITILDEVEVTCMLSGAYDSTVFITVGPYLEFSSGYTPDRDSSEATVNLVVPEVTNYNLIVNNGISGVVFAKPAPTFVAVLDSPTSNGVNYALYNAEPNTIYVVYVFDTGAILSIFTTSPTGNGTGDFSFSSFGQYLLAVKKQSSGVMTANTVRLTYWGSSVIYHFNNSLDSATAYAPAFRMSSNVTPVYIPRTGFGTFVQLPYSSAGGSSLQLNYNNVPPNFPSPYVEPQVYTEWTVEWWQPLGNAQPRTNLYLASGSAVSSINIETGNRLQFTMNGDARTMVNAPGSTVWGHIAIVRRVISSTNWQTMCFWNGMRNDGYYDSSTLYSNTADCLSSITLTTLSASPADIDEMRISNYPRYTENFTPPTGPFTS
jgi:hypothetical protein